MNKDGENNRRKSKLEGKKRILRNNKIIPPAVQNERQPRNTATIRPETLKVFTLDLTQGRPPLQIQMSLFGGQYHNCRIY